MQKLGAHPDLGGENWTASHLNAAYKTLSDPDRRAAYDRELLAEFDIEVIAEGRPKSKARRETQSPRADINRRNYYRILQTQRDAPFEILQASHAALRATSPHNAVILDEALALLGNKELRATYDRLLGACGHQDALVRIHSELGANPAYQPLIKAYCAFCKRPHSSVEEHSPDARCVECRSPLFPPPRALLELARRTLERVSRADPVTLFFDWPSQGIPGRVTDLSPTGMRCETNAPLDQNDVVKITSDHFDAVGSVAYTRHIESLTEAGMRFLTVRFPRAVGTFRSLKV